MAVITSAGTTTEGVRNFHGQAPEERIDVALRMAARTVAYLAPPPELEDAEYRAACSDGELTLASYALATRFGQDSSKGIGDLSRSLRDDQVVRRMVQDALGSYFQAPDATEVPSVGYIGTFRH